MVSQPGRGTTIKGIFFLKRLILEYILKMRNKKEKWTMNLNKNTGHFNNGLDGVGLCMRHLSLPPPHSRHSSCQKAAETLISPSLVRYAEANPQTCLFSLTFLLSCLFPRSLLRTLAGLLVILAFYQRGVRWSTFHWCCSELDEHRKWQWLHTYWSPDMPESIYLTDVNAVRLNLRSLPLLGDELSLMSQHLIVLCYS